MSPWPDVDFGPLANPHDVGRSIRDHHKKWIDTYLAAVEDFNGKPQGPFAGGYARPVTYAIRNVLESLPGEEDTPAIYIVQRGGATDPGQPRRGWDITWQIGIACVTASFEDDGAREVAGAYAIATAGLMLQRRNLDARMDGKLRVVQYVEVRMDDVPGREARNRAIVRQEFLVQQSSVVWSDAGPINLDDPPPDPYVPPGDWPPVEDVQVTTSKEDHT